MLVRRQFITARKLDSGNPNPGNIGADFDRLEISFWPAVVGYDARNADRQRLLVTLNQWRNAIAHRLRTRTLPTATLQAATNSG
jgi:hypothetical protein